MRLWRVAVWPPGHAGLPVLSRAYHSRRAALARAERLLVAHPQAQVEIQRSEPVAWTEPFQAVSR